MFYRYRKREQQQQEETAQATLQHLSELQARWRTLDKETQYQIAKDSAEQVGRRDEAFIMQLLQEME
jgi:hypothetical protein